MSSAFEGLPKTPNLKLNKPGYDNVADIEALNENADILDEEIQGIKNTFVKSVNGKEPDAGGNVNVEEYTHPNSGVTAGTYRSVTVNAQGHVTAGSNPTLAIANGGTGATTAEQARKNLDANGFVTSLSVSGRTITYTKKDGTTDTITTQDTNTSNWTLSKATNGYARDNTTGLTIQWGVNSIAGRTETTITFPKAFSHVYSVVAQSAQTGGWNSDANGSSILSKSTTSFKMRTQAAGSNYYWIAIGVS